MRGGRSVRHLALQPRGLGQRGESCSKHACTRRAAGFPAHPAVPHASPKQNDTSHCQEREDVGPHIKLQAVHELYAGAQNGGCMAGSRAAAKSKGPSRGVRACTFSSMACCTASCTASWTASCTASATACAPAAAARAQNSLVETGSRHSRPAGTGRGSLLPQGQAPRAPLPPRRPPPPLPSAARPRLGFRPALSASALAGAAQQAAGARSSSSNGGILGSSAAGAGCGAAAQPASRMLSLSSPSSS